MVVVVVADVEAEPVDTGVIVVTYVPPAVNVAPTGTVVVPVVVDVVGTVGVVPMMLLVAPRWIFATMLITV